MSYVLFVPLHVDPDVYIATDNRTFDVDEKVTLICKIENHKVFFTAKWIREKTKQIVEIANFSYDPTPKHYYHKFDYVIDHVSTKDEGEYICVANYHDNGTQQDTYTLRVKGK